MIKHFYIKHWKFILFERFLKAHQVILSVAIIQISNTHNFNNVHFYTNIKIIWGVTLKSFSNSKYS